MNVDVAGSGGKRVAALSAILALLALPAILVAGAASSPAAAAEDSSAVTVSAAQQDPDLASAPLPDLSVTVSQTADLAAQGIRLTYSGGVKSTSPGGGTAGQNFLQVFQCWGDLKDANGKLILDQNGQPQPDRETCQYGGSHDNGQSRTSFFSFTNNEFVAAEDVPYAYFGTNNFDTTEVTIPFKAVNGKVLQRIVDGKIVSAADIDDNEFFTRSTTNEVPWMGFGASGEGTATFEVQTNAQAPGLGCGNPVTAADGSVTGQPCWLVILPRGTSDPGEANVIHSGLLSDAWKHRLAVKLDFKPLGVRCSIGAAEKALAGSELLAGAVASWQPKLCGAAGGSIFNLILAAESDQALAANGTDTEALALTTRALSVEGVRDNLTYAPVGLSGLTVAFAIDHNASPIMKNVPAAVSGLNAQPITTMNLTPRLVAKLLTNSYKSSHYTAADTSHLGSNPNYLWQDPDFLAVNDDVWKYQDLSAPGRLADLLVPLGRSDAAWVVWQYVLSDPEAVSFLEGKPDPWGMVVNPYSSTNATANPTGTAATYPKESFPKADPTAYVPPDGAGEINLVTYRPYASDLDNAGYWVLRGDNRSLDVSSWYTPGVAFPKYGVLGRDTAGRQKVLGLTDTASAAKYQLFTAALRNPAGEFVAPTAASMAAAAAVMTPVTGQPQVRALDYTSAAVKAATAAYPLTVPVYAATNPAGGDAATRAAYASFIRYAVGPGQVPGTNDGQLPAGYAPLPTAWVETATKAADTIAAGPTPTPTATPTPTPTPTPVVAVSRPAGSTSVESAEPDAAAAGPDAGPTATGPAAGAITGPATPKDPDIGALRAVVPAGAAAGLLAAAGIPLVARIRRRP